MFTRKRQQERCRFSLLDTHMRWENLVQGVIDTLGKCQSCSHRRCNTAYFCYRVRKHYRRLYLSWHTHLQRSNNIDCFREECPFCSFRTLVCQQTCLCTRNSLLDSCGSPKASACTIEGHIFRKAKRLPKWVSRRIFYTHTSYHLKWVTCGRI